MPEQKFSTNGPRRKRAIMGRRNAGTHDVDDPIIVQDDFSGIGESDEAYPDYTNDYSDRQNDGLAGRTDDEKRNAGGYDLSDDVIKISMLGSTGSGKTWFLSGIYQTLVSDKFEGVGLIASDRSADSFLMMGKMSDIALITKPDFDYNNGTEDTTVFPMSMTYKGKTVCEVDFADYRGGDVQVLMQETARGDIQAENLKSRLEVSDAIMVFVDATKLIKGDQHILWQRDTSASIITPILMNLIKKKADAGKPVTILLVLTKTDDLSIDDKFKKNRCQLLVDRALQVYKSVANETIAHYADGWNFAVVPVSAVGEGNTVMRMQTDESGNPIIDPLTKKPSERAVVDINEGKVPDPKNIAECFIYTILNVMGQRKKELDRERNELRRELVAAGSRNNMVSTLNSWRKKQEKPEEIVQRRRRELDAKQNEYKAIFHDLELLSNNHNITDAIQMRKDHL